VKNAEEYAIFVIRSELLYMRYMPEHITENAIVHEEKRSYFDEHLYTELKAFIWGDTPISADKGGEAFVPSFEAVIEKMNSYNLRRDLRVRIISETFVRILSEVGENKALPSFLLSYLCRETIKRAVLCKFNEVLGWGCVDLLGLSHKIGDNIAEANRVFLSLRICDPSVYMGDFLCTMLNEMIAVKSQLGILTDKNGNPLYRYKFVVGENGHLDVLDKKEFKRVILDGITAESRQIREALYDEKVKIIRNCLFGVDVNPFHVLVCKLRLWLDVMMTSGEAKEADLMSIESNIICGDALVSRFSLKDDLLVALKNVNQTVHDYKKLADHIKTIKDADDRRYLIELMSLIQNRLVEGIGWYSKDTEELLRLRREHCEIMSPGLFPLSEREEHLRNEKVLLLNIKIKKQEQQLSLFRHHPSFEQAVEWRYVFPELLDDKGAFTGFDAVIGTLPDATIAGIGEDKAGLYKRMNYRVYKRTGYVSDLFCELANRILKYGGCMSFVMSPDWRNDTYDSKLVDYFVSETNPLQLIIMDELSSSYETLKDKCAVIIQKDVNRHHAVTCRIDVSYDPRVVDLGVYIRQFATPVFRPVEKAATLISAIASNAEYMSINNKIKTYGLLVRNWEVHIYSGVMTGFDEAYILNREAREKLIHTDVKNSDIIKPLLTGDLVKRYSADVPEQWLLYIPWHFPLQYDKTIRAASERAEQRFRLQYPDAYNHLLAYKSALSSRNTIEVGLGFEWYALQRSGMNNNWGDFAEQKMVWKKDSPDCRFGFDYGGCAVLEDVCFMVGQHLKFLLGVFNSTMGRYMLSGLSRLSTGESRVGVPVIESMSVPVPNAKMESDIIALVNRRISENEKNANYAVEIEEQIDRLVYELYHLTEEEAEFVRLHVSSMK
jgi:hypothetical protein